MKRIISLFACMVLSLSVFAYDMCYSIKCPACQRKASTCPGCVATRDTRLEYKELFRHCGYRIYRCQHGHELHIPFNVKPEYSLSDIEVYVSGTTIKVSGLDK